MAQVTTGEISFLVSVLVTAEIAGLGVLTKVLINTVLKRIGTMETQQNTLQSEIPKLYMTKHDCEVMIGRMDCGRKKE